MTDTGASAGERAVVGDRAPTPNDRPAASDRAAPDRQDDMATGADAPNTFAGAVVPGGAVSPYVWRGTGWLGATDDDDFYKIVVSAPGMPVYLGVSLASPGGASYAVEILDPGGKVISQSFAMGANQQADARPSVSGDYRIHVHRNSGAGLYHLFIAGGVAPTVLQCPSGPSYGSCTSDANCGPGYRCQGTGCACAHGVQLTTPQLGQTVSGVITVSGTATSAAGVREIHLQIDAQDVAPVFYPSPMVQSAAFQFQWDSRTVANGQHTINIQMNDLPGSGFGYGFSQLTISN